MGGFYKNARHSDVLLHPNGGGYKKTTIGNRHCRYNQIVRAVTIANFTIDQPALLENSCKIATMGGGQLSLCQKIGLSLFIVCLFLWVFKEL
jgi:hypothetical protein